MTVKATFIFGIVSLSILPRPVAKKMISRMDRGEKMLLLRVNVDQPESAFILMITLIGN